MDWIEIDEGLVDRRRIVVAELFEIELAEIAIDAILVIPRSIRAEEGSDGFRAAEIGETQTDHPIGVCNSLRVRLVFGLVEVVSDRCLVVEEGDVVEYRLVEKHLFVEGPAKLVERELVVSGARTMSHDRGVGLLRIEHLLPCKEVLSAPELKLIDVSRLWVLGNEQGRDFNRLVDFPEFLVGTCLLIENLIVMRIVRIGRKNLVVEFDRFERSGRIGRHVRGKFEVERFARERIDDLARNPFFEVAFGFPIDIHDCG